MECGEKIRRGWGSLKMPTKFEKIKETLIWIGEVVNNGVNLFTPFIFIILFLDHSQFSNHPIAFTIFITLFSISTIYRAYESVKNANQH